MKNEHRIRANCSYNGVHVVIKARHERGVSRRTFGTYIWTGAATWAEEEEAGSIKSEEGKGRMQQDGRIGGEHSAM